MSKALRTIYNEEEEDYKEQKRKGKVDTSKFANNYFLIHFGFFDYPTRNPSFTDERYVDTKRLGYNGGGEY